MSTLATATRKFESTLNEYSSGPSPLLADTRATNNTAAKLALPICRRATRAKNRSRTCIGVFSH
jgi:hypothetical protein